MKNKYLVVKQTHVLTSFDNEADAYEYAKRHKARVKENNYE